MIVVYEAEHAIEAHMLRGLLEQAGVAVHISGEYLLGAMGELPAQGLVRLLVNEEDFALAREVIMRYEDGLASN